MSRHQSSTGDFFTCLVTVVSITSRKNTLFVCALSCNGATTERYLAGVALWMSVDNSLYDVLVLLIRKLCSISGQSTSYSKATNSSCHDDSAAAHNFIPLLVTFAANRGFLDDIQKTSSLTCLYVGDVIRT